MGALRLFTSNRLEIMAEVLAGVLGEPPASPLDPEIILVQSKGMERWLSMQLAAYQGICANCRFPFPNAFVHEIFRKVLENVPERSVFEPQVMTWRIMKVLPSLMEKKGFEELRLYLVGAQGGLKLFQLSERIADIYDQYVVFRPEMIFQWEKGQGDHWQASLWRELATQGANPPRSPGTILFPRCQVRRLGARTDPKEDLSLRHFRAPAISCGDSGSTVTLCRGEPVSHESLPRILGRYSIFMGDPKARGQGEEGGSGGTPHGKGQQPSGFYGGAWKRFFRSHQRTQLRGISCFSRPR